MIGYSGPVISSSSAEYNTIKFRIYLLEQSILQLLFQNKRYIGTIINTIVISNFKPEKLLQQ